MINWYNKWKNQIRQNQKEKGLLDKLAREKARYAKLKELSELRLITLNNVRYLGSYISTLNSVVNCMKGNNAAETKRKREGARRKLIWLESKLIEEKGMLIHWENQMRKVN